MDRYLIKVQEPCTSKVQESCSKESRSNNNSEIETDLTNYESSDPASSTSETEASQECNTVSPNKKQKLYKQKYREDWQKELDNPDWLMCTKNNEPYCKTCKRVLHGSITHVKRHELSQFHRKRYNASKNSVKITETFKSSSEGFLCNQIKTAELRLGMFIAEHNIPIRLLEHLPQFILAICPDSKIAAGIKCSRTKGSNIIVNNLAPSFLRIITSKMKDSKFSLIIDECTDISSKKCLGVVVRCLHTHKVKDVFLTLLELESSTAESIFSAVKSFLVQHDIPLFNLIGIAADNAAVMMGNNQSVKTKFKNEIPNLFVIGCTCHSLNLCASAACLKLSKTVEDLARDIFSYFSHSAKRIKEFELYQNFCLLKPHKLLYPAQTRWLSLECVVNRILEQWPALVQFFTTAAAKDNLQSAQTISNALDKTIYKAYFLFLSYVLKIINKMNLQFQSEKPQITNLLSILESQYRLLLINYMNRRYVQETKTHLINPQNRDKFLDVEQIYLGAQAEVVSSKLNKKEAEGFRLRCLDFYIELCTQIKNRVDFENPILNQLKILNPKSALSGEVASIVPLIQMFPNIIDLNDGNLIENINTEWRLLPDCKNNIKNCDDLEQFWYEVGQIKNNLDTYMFQNLTNFVQTLLCLPHSSASTERVFSQLNLIKTKTRNRLSIETCNALQTCKEYLRVNNQTCYTYQPCPGDINKRNNVSNKNCDIFCDM